ncbi:mechanosensitive ion channel family protein [Galbibacter pacificus]|uniref:Mechanosensitive ion channel n=1 Tax=Galbibacter pacificus TaxID=2996052 RepID=A0ABT6FMK8_9FLAO|nr:mechanosensitive ion channel domain-containing protein [Galbibacter pacificus]MDG3580944.1 mechanosensitive ion channel [Galbibacter pacificus]MDG3584422.1 mechanosensitive ion channel [Galbibacter pacificus]
MTLLTSKKIISPILFFVVSLVLKSGAHSFLNFNKETEYIVGKISSILLIISIAWMLIAILKALKKRYLKRYSLDNENNLDARKLYTQFNILERIIIFIIVLISIAAIFMLFDGVRKLGISLFASAGVAGIILGFAAQKVIGTILAGLQIAIAQPIRLDDVLVVEGEWGWVEEITLTFVVVRIWDKRRLILPTTYFIETPFQNWTRTNADILGTVFIYTDYNVPFDALRKEFTRLLEGHNLWDGKANVLQVTDCRENYVEIRALMSAKNSPQAWDLRVYIREKLITFIQQNYPDSFSKTRVIVKDLPKTDIDTSKI